MEFYSFDTPYGCMAMAQEWDHIVRLFLPSDPMPRIMSYPTPLLKEGERQLLEYFQGELQQFDLPLNPQGTPFQQRVWAALREIPCGQTRSYKELAGAAGCPQGFQAVGQANGENPIPILIPCHRVIAADGSLGGYRGGPELKRSLLSIEGIHIPE